jgi:F-type H+-transporting ATPase subunit b
MSGSTSLPQLDISTLASQSFWFLLCFFALWAVMHFFLLPRLVSVIHNRESYVDKLVRETQDINQEIKSVEKDAVESRSLHRQELDKLIVSYRSETEAKVLTIKSEFDDKLSALRSDLKRDLQSQEEKISKETKEVITALSGVAIDAIIADDRKESS